MTVLFLICLFHFLIRTCLPFRLFPDRINMGPSSLAATGHAKAYVIFKEPGSEFCKQLSWMLTVLCIIICGSAVLTSAFIIIGFSFDRVRGCFQQHSRFVGGVDFLDVASLVWPLGTVVLSGVFLVTFARNGLGRLAFRFLIWWVARQKAFALLALPLVVVLALSIKDERTPLRLTASFGQLFAYPLGLAVFDLSTTLLDVPQRVGEGRIRVPVRVSCVVLCVVNVLQLARIQSRSLFGCSEVSRTSTSVLDVVLNKVESTVHAFVFVVTCSVYIRKFLNPMSPAVIYAVGENFQERWSEEYV